MCGLVQIAAADFVGRNDLQILLGSSWSLMVSCELLLSRSFLYIVSLCSSEYYSYIDFHIASFVLAKWEVRISIACDNPAVLNQIQLKFLWLVELDDHLCTV